ncbi:MAG: hypothetical protein AABY53_01205 [Bdellovibrionota bacterium]
MSSLQYLRTNTFLRTLIFSIICLFSASSFAQQKGGGPFSIETEVKLTDSSKSQSRKGKVYFNISYSESDAVIKIKNPRSETNCFSVGKRSAMFFGGISAKKQVTYKGHMNFKILNTVTNCDLVFEVEAKDKATTQSTTKTIKLL